MPPPKFGLRNLFETLADTIFNLMASVMGEKEARRYLPLIGTLFFFILFSNLLALIPGFLPPTDTLKTNLMLSVMVFLLTHVFGVKSHGIKYFKHFMGPVWWLAPLMIPIEIVSHLARPVSLSMRLLGNIAADHAVVLALLRHHPLPGSGPLPPHGGVRLGRPGDRLLVALHRLHRSGRRSRRALAGQSNCS